jgi:2-keto-4-pentenoate hydratase/2-oxohepta-3-ene-1,7-dioic acid hydratase in catechol pathway
MKLFRFGEKGEEKPGVIYKDGIRLDASAFGEDYSRHFFETGGPDRLAAWLEGHWQELPEVGEKVRLGPAICRPGKIVCIGLNYSDHAAESGMKIPPEPVLFFKASSAFSGPEDNVIIPRNAEKLDWEVELAMVIGQRASYVDESDAAKHIAGYALHNDYSEREFQLERGGQWVKGKSADTFAPFGPYLVTPDEIPDVNNLNLWLEVNGERVQNSNSKNLVHKPLFLVSYISRFMTLDGGDIISTGTPGGVGLGRKPPRYLQPGDSVTSGVDLLGECSQKIVAYPG